jgi:hypothetical protein
MLMARRRRQRLNNTLAKPEKINALPANEKQEIDILKGKIEKIKNLEEEKKNLLLELEKLKKH